MPPVLLSLVGALVRTLLAGVAGWLIEKGVLSSDQVAELVMGVTMILGVLLWSGWQKVASYFHIQAALQMPPGSTYEDLKEQMKSDRGPFPPASLMVVLAVLLVGGACASVPAKARLSQDHQTVRQALVAVDEAERLLCRPGPPDHCTAQSAAVIGLTDERHQEISRKLADAFMWDIKASGAIIAWRAGDPVPNDIRALVQATHDLLAAVLVLTDASLQQRATLAVVRAQSLQTAFTKGAPQ